MGAAKEFREWEPAFLYKALNFMGCLESQRRWASEPDADVKQNGIE